MAAAEPRRPPAWTAAVVVNHRTPDETLACLAALRASATPPRQLIAVDNGSDDGSALRLATVPGLSVVVSARNLGFSGGANLGIRRALADHAEQILLINSDAVLAPDALGLLDAALAADPGLGLVGPTLVTAATPATIESRGIAYAAATGRVRNLAAGRPATQDRGVVPVDAISGCVMLVRRAVFDAVGLFDERYFYGLEDVELCLRARAGGFAAACVLDARAVHAGARSIGRRSPRRIYFATRNHLLLASRARPAEPRPLALLRGCAVVGFNLAHVLFTADVPVGPGLRALAGGVADHLRGRYGADRTVAGRAASGG
jgi:GT2 family glycosyltransferase